MRVSDIELKELAKIQGWASALAQECITAREHCPAIEAECKRLHEENLRLKATLRDYADMQMRMIDERIKMVGGPIHPLLDRSE